MRFGVLLRVSGNKMHHSILRILVDSIDLTDCTVTMHEKKIEMGAADFKHVMGLRNMGSVIVFEGYISDLPELIKIKNSVCGNDNKLNLKDVQVYLKETNIVDDKFKHLFVMFTMSTILSPNASSSRRSGY